MNMCELGSVSESKNVQSLRRLSILCYVTPGCLFQFLPVSGPFFLKSMSNNTGEAMVVKYVVCIYVVCLEVDGPNLRVSWA